MMKTILVVDDEKSIRALCEAELSREGYDVISTAVGEEVPGLIVSRKPCLLILDIQLDEGDAFGLLADIRTKNPGLPIIIYSAYDSYRDDARSTPADYYVVKSYDLAELKVSIAKAMTQNVTTC